MFLLTSITKNTSMSVILFYSLYQFYAGLKKIHCNFEIDKRNLAVHVVAFGIPVLAGIFYLISIIYTNPFISFYI